MSRRIDTVYHKETASSKILNKVDEIINAIDKLQTVIDSFDKRIDVLECHVNALVEASTLDDS